MASGGGRVAPLGPPLVSFVLLLALLAASCLAKAPPEAKKKPPGPFWKPFWPQTCSFFDIFFWFRGSFFELLFPPIFITRPP